MSRATVSSMFEATTSGILSHSIKKRVKVFRPGCAIQKISLTKDFVIGNLGDQLEMPGKRGP